MPAVVIKNLRLLMEVLARRVNLKAEVVLGEGKCPKLPADAYDLLDDIQDAARSVFGGMQPTQTQLRMMEGAGFPLIWGAGLIRTPKGSVRYKPGVIP